MEFPVETELHSGLSAIVLWNSNTGKKPLIGAYFSPEYGWIPVSWTEEGHYFSDKERQETLHSLDLVWVREKRLDLL